MNPQQPGGPWPQDPQQQGQAPYQTPNSTPQQPYGQPQTPNQFPNLQYGPPAQQQQPYHQQFDFIMSPGTSRRGNPFSGSGTTVRLLVAGVGALALIVAVAVFFSILNRPKISTTELVTVAQEQTELVRVAQEGMNSANGQIAKNTAITVQLSLTSDQKQLLQYMGKQNIKISARALKLKQSAQTDSQLATALSSSTFDSTFLSIMQTQLAAYQNSLQAAYKTKPGPQGQKLLSDEYKAAGLLLTQSQQK